MQWLSLFALLDEKENLDAFEGDKISRHNTTHPYFVPRREEVG